MDISACPSLGCLCANAEIPNTHAFFYYLKYIFVKTFVRCKLYTFPIVRLVPTRPVSKPSLKAWCFRGSTCNKPTAFVMVAYVAALVMLCCLATGFFGIRAEFGIPDSLTTTES